MNIGGFRWPRLRPQLLDVELEHAKTAPLTYADAGATLDGATDVRRFGRSLGDDPAAFDRAVRALQAWAPQRRLGAMVYPGDARVVTGETLLLVLPVGPVELLAPVRVVRVVDERDRFGYAYGTLPGHPEDGEESFLVERAPDGNITATIGLRARPGTLLAKVGGPVTTRLQGRAIATYLDALA